MTTQPATKDTWSASTYNQKASFVYSSAFTSPVLGLLDAKPGERVIDFGCGSGELALQISKLVGDQGVVVGVDSSQSMIEKAIANGLEHAFVSDIQDLQFPIGFDSQLQSGFDAVFTNAALHWCKRDPRGVLESVKKVLKSRGRFVGEMGGYMNCIGVRASLHQVLRRRGYDPIKLDPWYFPSVEDYTLLLESAGFVVRDIALIPRPTSLPNGLIDWLHLFCRKSILGSITDDAEVEEIFEEVEKICEIDCKDAQGRWTMMYARL